MIKSNQRAAIQVESQNDQNLINEYRTNLLSLKLEVQFIVLKNLPKAFLAIWAENIKQTLINDQNIENLSLIELIILAQFYRSAEALIIDTKIFSNPFYSSFVRLGIYFHDLVALSDTTIETLKMFSAQFDQELLNVKIKDLLEVKERLEILINKDNICQAVQVPSFYLRQLNEALNYKNVTEQLQILADLETNVIKNLGNEFVKKFKTLNNPVISNLMSKPKLQEIISFKELIILAKYFKNPNQAEVECQFYRGSLTNTLTSFGLSFSELRKLNPQTINKFEELAQYNESLGFKLLETNLNEFKMNRVLNPEVFHDLIRSLTDYSLPEVARKFKITRFALNRILDSEFKNFLQENYAAYYESTLSVQQICQKIMYSNPEANMPQQRAQSSWETGVVPHAAESSADEQKPAAKRLTDSIVHVSEQELENFAETCGTYNAKSKKARTDRNLNFEASDIDPFEFQIEQILATDSIISQEEIISSTSTSRAQETYARSTASLGNSSCTMFGSIETTDLIEKREDKDHEDADPFEGLEPLMDINYLYSI